MSFVDKLKEFWKKNPYFFRVVPGLLLILVIFLGRIGDAAVGVIALLTIFHIGGSNTITDEMDQKTHDMVNRLFKHRSTDVDKEFDSFATNSEGSKPLSPEAADSAYVNKKEPVLTPVEEEVVVPVDSVMEVSTDHSVDSKATEFAASTTDEREHSTEVESSVPGNEPVMEREGTTEILEADAFEVKYEETSLVESEGLELSEREALNDSELLSESDTQSDSGRINETETQTDSEVFIDKEIRPSEEETYHTVTEAAEMEGEAFEETLPLQEPEEAMVTEEDSLTHFDDESQATALREFADEEVTDETPLNQIQSDDQDANEEFATDINEYNAEYDNYDHPLEDSYEELASELEKTAEEEQYMEEIEATHEEVEEEIDLTNPEFDQAKKLIEETKTHQENN